MKKTLIVMTIAMLTFVGKAYAEVTFGLSAAVTKINASGTETEGATTSVEKTSANADNTVVVPSVFAEYAYTDTVSLGLDYIPMSADVSNKAKSRTEIETSVTGTVTTTSTSRTNKAQAELKNHVTLYTNVMLNDTMFVKAGVAFVELNTTESLGTGSKYGSEDIFGGVVGLGAKSDNHRFELIYTDYEDISIKSSVANAGITNNNKIDADLDTLAFKYSYAF
mgnify:CR=1 FL=1|tara:strand:+ start:408 stop:1076 length:669 start_codon:yes stop_codon:yes gene_type:complete